MNWNCKVVESIGTASGTTAGTVQTGQTYTTSLISRSTAAGTGDPTHYTQYIDNLEMELGDEQQVMATYPVKDRSSGVPELKTDLKADVKITMGENSVLKLGEINKTDMYVSATVYPLAAGFTEIMIRQYSDDGNYDITTVYTFNVIPKPVVTETTRQSTPPVSSISDDNGNTTTTTTTTTTVVTMATTASSTAESTVTELPEAQVKRGDLNCDNQLDVKDGVLLARVIGQDPNVQVSDQGLANADVNADGLLTTYDVVKLLRVVAKLETAEINDIEEIRSLLSEYIKKNKLSAVLKTNSEYPGNKPIVVVYYYAAEVNAWTVIQAYLKENHISDENISAVTTEYPIHY